MELKGYPEKKEFGTYLGIAFCILALAIGMRSCLPEAKDKPLIGLHGVIIDTQKEISK